MTDIAITLTQATDGSLTGTYTAIGTNGLQFCPPAPPCRISGTIAGTNNVLQIFFYMKDAGTFTGQISAPGTMGGAMSRVGSIEPVTFTRP
jgi:hypothetical protein